MKRTLDLWPILLLFVTAILTPTLAARAQTATPPSMPSVIVMRANGEVLGSMTAYIERGIQAAEGQQAKALIIQLDTPGGDITEMTKIVEDIRASKVPVIVYVSPEGAMAGSAGTLITLAGHLAAMAPQTTIGAASPIQGNGQDIGGTLETKIKNMLSATARSLAERRGPEAVKLAEDTIQIARAVSSSEALKAGLVDFIAKDVNDLLTQIDGKTVTIDGKPVTLYVKDAMQDQLPPTPIEQAVQFLTNPNFILILLTVGVLALLLELASPGGWVAGFIGVVCLALAVYGLGLIPVNWFGVVFLILAFVLFILDIKAPTHGVLTAAGAASFIIGALILFNSPDVPAFQRVSVPLVFAAGISTAALFFVALTVALRWQNIPVLTGKQTLIGKTGKVKSALNPRGTVQVGGEVWSAEVEPGSPSLPADTEIVVVSINGLRLIVRPI
jgi:membrane-bound serine protease (ClpP class)